MPISIAPKTLLDFDLYLYTKTPNYIIVPPFKTLHSFRFLVNLDISEYQLDNFLSGSEIAGCSSLPPIGAVVSTGFLECDFKPNVGVYGAFGFFNPIKLGTFKGTTISPGLAPDDGISDFKLTLVQLLYAPGNIQTDPVDAVADQFQDVEFQTVPGPLFILGVGAAFGYSCKLRKCIKTSKTPEVMSAID